MRFVKLLFLLSLFLVVDSAKAQDFHFSQFYNSPLTLNPALTGNVKQDFRVGVIHRTQWKSVNSPYSTSDMFADVNFTKNPFGLDRWGVGLVAVDDQIGDGLFSNQQLGISISGTKALDQLKRHKLSFGIQPSYEIKGLNSSNLSFDNQVNSSYQIDKSIASGEQLNTNRYSFFNLNAGVFWDFTLNQKINLFAGYSASNLTRPKEYPLTSMPGNLPMRHTFNPGFVYTISPKWTLTPNFLFVYQAKATEMNLGLNGAYTFNPNKSNPTTVFLGLWYRTQDAIIPTMGTKWGHYQLTFSYDYTVSSLRDVTNAPTVGQRAFVGAWEVSFIYVGFLKRALPNATTVPCKFF